MITGSQGTTRAPILIGGPSRRFSLARRYCQPAEKWWSTIPRRYPDRDKACCRVVVNRKRTEDVGLRGEITGGKRAACGFWWRVQTGGSTPIKHLSGCLTAATPVPAQRTPPPRTSLIASGASSAGRRARQGRSGPEETRGARSHGAKCREVRPRALGGGTSAQLKSRRRPPVEAKR